jgi:hypothetical protein
MLVKPVKTFPAFVESEGSLLCLYKSAVRSYAELLYSCSYLHVLLFNICFNTLIILSFML